MELRDPCLFSSHDISTDAEEYLDAGLTVASLWPRCSLSHSSQPFLPLLFPPPSQKQAATTGGLCGLSVLTHISCPKCLERQLKIHQDNRSREDEEEIGQTA